MKIGILQTGHAPDALMADSGDYDEMFAHLLSGHGFTFETFPVVDGIFPSGPNTCDGWLITGSRHGVYEAHDWIPPLEALIRDIKSAGLPLIGICFGHQIIAQALGGKVEKFDGGWSIGPQSYEIDGQPMTMMAWHQDQVTTPPQGAQIIGSSAFCANAAMLVGDKILTIQPHPEFDEDFVGGLIHKRGRGVVPDAQLDHALDTLSTPLDSPAFARMMAQFFAENAEQKNAK